MSDESIFKAFYDISIGAEVREFQRRTLYGKVRQLPWIALIGFVSLLWVPLLALYAGGEWLAEHQPTVYKDQ